MTTHVMKAGPLDSLATRCGIPLTGPNKRAKKGDKVGTEHGLPYVDCVGCLRDLLVDERFQRLNLEDNPQNRWLCGGDTGRSSATIFSVMTGVPLASVDRKGFEAAPSDPSDFARCHKLLNLFPEWRARLPEVAEKYPEWAGLVSEWSALTALFLEEVETGTAPKLYARMRELLGRDG